MLQKSMVGAHLRLLGLESVVWRTTNVCDARPVRRQSYGYLPSRKAISPIAGTKLYCLVTEAHVC